ncbi:hypothetical protein L1887_48830 [Cichorium endivia]|nr:hypothetical protein L1887_48830 [Cichorium endivia]
MCELVRYGPRWTCERAPYLGREQVTKSDINQRGANTHRVARQLCVLVPSIAQHELADRTNNNPTLCLKHAPRRTTIAPERRVRLDGRVEAGCHESRRQTSLWDVAAERLLSTTLLSAFHVGNPVCLFGRAEPLSDVRSTRRNRLVHSNALDRTLPDSTLWPLAGVTQVYGQRDQCQTADRSSSQDRLRCSLSNRCCSLDSANKGTKRAGHYRHDSYKWSPSVKCEHGVMVRERGWKVACSCWCGHLFRARGCSTHSWCIGRSGNHARRRRLSFLPLLLEPRQHVLHTFERGSRRTFVPVDDDGAVFDAGHAGVRVDEVLCQRGASLLVSFQVEATGRLAFRSTTSSWKADSLGGSAACLRYSDAPTPPPLASTTHDSPCDPLDGAAWAVRRVVLVSSCSTCFEAGEEAS